jgi:predicted nucleotidyltransferase component of viral defense system
MLWKNTVSPALLTMVAIIQNNPLFKDYILAGGTALSLQLGHRQSIDIDLFTINKQNNHSLLEYFRDNFNNIEILYNDTSILQIIVNNIKIDMVYVKGKLLETPVTDDGITLFGTKDIAAMKLLAITDRKKPKDYIDIAYLLKDMPLETMFEQYRQKYGVTDITNVKKALAEVNYVNPYDWQKVKMIKDDLFVSDVPSIIKAELLKYNTKHGIGRKSLLDFFKVKRG